jgi:UDP-4-amino-4,6-dideoxy-N-acetyl-beta-L-altrosamine N-acetyltransferase
MVEVANDQLNTCWMALVFDSCKVRKMTEADLLMVLEWRNHADVRRFMFTQHEISHDEHRNWFAKSTQDQSRCLLIVEEEKQAIGYVQFKNKECGGIADWGFYTRINAPKGTGLKLGIMALNHAFGPLKLHKVCGQAIACNQNSIAFHQRLGFQLEGVLREQQFIRDAHHSIYCFGMLSTEWQSKA